MSNSLRNSLPGLSVEEVVPYSLRQDRLPEWVQSDLRGNLFILGDVVQTSRPSFISHLALPIPRIEGMPRFSHLNAFGKFRSRYKALVQTAEVLAPFYLQSSVLPLVHPLTQLDWEREVETQGSVFTRLKKSGLLLFVAP